MIELVMPDLPGAQCAETDPEAFFPGAGVDQSGAKAMCAACPIETREACLEFALSESIDGETVHGIWGGTNPAERALILKERGSTRRRKTTGPRVIKNPARCGTRSGYAKHRRDGEQACLSCLDAERVR